MKHRGLPFWQSLLREESGQVLPVVCVMLVVLLAFTGLVVDIGRAYLCHRELQASCDAAALAGATAMAGATSNPLASTASQVRSIATIDPALKYYYAA